MTPPVLTELRIAPFHYPVATSYTQAYTPFPPIPLRLGDPFYCPPPLLGASTLADPLVPRLQETCITD